MYPLIALMTGMVLAIILTGLYLHFRPLPADQARRWFKPTMATNLVVFFGAQLALLALGVNDVSAAAPAMDGVVNGVKEISVGMGLAFIGVALPTAFSTLAAAVAVGPIGAASLAVVAERPEIFGRTLVYLGLAEGIAIYGLVLSILLFEKL